MKIFKSFLWLAFTIATSLPAQIAPVIVSFSQNGELVCTNLTPGTVASVEWASSLSGPWQTNWAGLGAVTVTSNGTIQVSVPMFYRVRGVPIPAGMALIPAGVFTMGATTNMGHESYSGETPQHSVYVSAFYMDKYEVTKALWDEVVLWNGGNGYAYQSGSGLGKAANHPVHKVSWDDAVKWCNARSQKEGLSPCYYTDAGLTTICKTGQVAAYVKWNANGYRLPTEAEWEKAARSGSNGQRFPWGNTITHSQANYLSSTNYSYDISPTRGYHPTFNDGIEPYTSPAGYFAPNEYGLYDIAGNVWEWCWDGYGSYSSDSQTDPRGSLPYESSRVVRGGGWLGFAINCRAADRGNIGPMFRDNYIGFRCARAAGQ